MIATASETSSTKLSTAPPSPSTCLAIGLVGCGAIGSALAQAIEQRFAAQARLVGLHDQQPAAAASLQRQLPSHPPVESLTALAGRSRLLIEAAGMAAVPSVARAAMTARCDLLVMSVGAFLQQPQLLDEMRAAGIRLHLPSGALAGLDGVKALRLGRIASATLTTRKPPAGLTGAPYLAARHVDPAAITQETVIFEGSAEEAAAGFPQNMNVAATLALLTLGARQTRVRILTGPAYRANSHEIEVVGERGRLTSRMESEPSLENPKTSQTAVWSAIATVQQLLEGVRVGT